jgi:fluoroacetyl-CoA thioesterase
LVSGLEPGITRTEEFEVAGMLVTDVHGTLGFSVLSTPGMIGMMEQTAAMLVYPLLGEGQATVGFEVCIKHFRGAPEGAACTATATLTDVIEGRKLRFDVEVVGPDGIKLGAGVHERRVVTAGR